MKNSTITRARVTAAAIGPRTMLTVDALDQERFQKLELLLPPGYVANPPPGTDLLVLECNGSRDHKVALGGDLLADTVADLQPGEIGLSRNGMTVLLRADGVYVSAGGQRVVIDHAETITLSTSGTIELTGPVDLVGDLNVTGSVIVNGTTLAVP